MASSARYKKSQIPSHISYHQLVLLNHCIFQSCPLIYSSHCLYKHFSTSSIPLYIINIHVRSSYFNTYDRLPEQCLLPSCKRKFLFRKVFCRKSFCLGRPFIDKAFLTKKIVASVASNIAQSFCAHQT